MINNYERTYNLFVINVINTKKDIFIGSNLINAQFLISCQNNGCAW